jgi:glutathione S-transferase
MQLIGSYTSPYVRKIRVLLLEKGLPFSFLEDIPWNEDSKATHYNPLGKVPILIDENGSVWYDSQIIAQYIESRHTMKPLMPAGPIAAVEVRQLETLADGITEAGIAIFLEKKRETIQQNPAWITRQQGKINRGLDTLENKLDGVVWLHNDSFSLADIAAGALLSWLDLRLPGLDWRKNRPKLGEFAERLFARESFKMTTPPDVS